MKNLFYIIFIFLLFLLMYWLNKDAPIPHQWRPTHDTNDKEPFGSYVFDKILHDSWDDEYFHNYYSLQDIADETTVYPEDDYPDFDNYSPEIRPEYNILITANYLFLDSVESKFLLNYVEKGGSVILAMESFIGFLRDTLNIVLINPYNKHLFDSGIQLPEENVCFFATDSVNINLTLPEPLVNNYFEILDTDNYTYYDSIYRISDRADKKTISLRYAIGKGNLILISNPLIFTNYGILNDSINPYIWKHLAYLEGKPLIRTEYYETGSQGRESQPEFRVILRERAFKWAFFTILAGVIVFMIFTAKRKQKIIPVIKPPANNMLAFIGSIAGLYLLKNNNADIILKKQIYWGEELKRKYGIDIVNEKQDADFYRRVAAKTNRPIDEILRLFILLAVINEKSIVPDDVMMQLVTKMNEI